MFHTRGTLSGHRVQTGICPERPRVRPVLQLGDTVSSVVFSAGAKHTGPRQELPKCYVPKCTRKCPGVTPFSPERSFGAHPDSSGLICESRFNKSNNLHHRHVVAHFTMSPLLQMMSTDIHVGLMATVFFSFQSHEHF